MPRVAGQIPPASRRWRARSTEVGVVWAGGALGSTARYLLGLALPARGHLPLATLAVNVLGAFLLGWLLAHLARSGAETRRRRLVRLGTGTGVLGGFTTYSALAVETAGLLAGRPGLALAYAGGSLLLGAGASCAGTAAGRGRRR